MLLHAFRSIFSLLQSDSRGIQLKTLSNVSALESHVEVGKKQETVLHFVIAYYMLTSASDRLCTWL